MTTAKIILDQTRITKKGYPIKIYLYNVKKKLISLNEFSELADWNGHNVKKSHPDYRRLWIKNIGCGLGKNQNPWYGKRRNDNAWFKVGLNKTVLWANQI